MDVSRSDYSDLGSTVCLSSSHDSPCCSCSRKLHQYELLVRKFEAAASPLLLPQQSAKSASRRLSAPSSAALRGLCVQFLQETAWLDTTDFHACNDFDLLDSTGVSEASSDAESLPRASLTTLASSRRGSMADKFVETPRFEQALQDSFTRHLLRNPDKLQMHLDSLLKEIDEKEAALHACQAALERSRQENQRLAAQPKAPRGLKVIRRNYRKSAQSPEQTLAQLAAAVDQALAQSEELPFECAQKIPIMGYLHLLRDLAQPTPPEPLQAKEFCSGLLRLCTSVRAHLDDALKGLHEPAAERLEYTRHALHSTLLGYFTRKPTSEDLALLAQLEHGECFECKCDPMGKSPSKLSGKQKLFELGKRQQVRIRRRLYKEEIDKLKRCTRLLLTGTEKLCRRPALVGLRKVLTADELAFLATSSA